MYCRSATRVLAVDRDAYSTPYDKRYDIGIRDINDE